MCRHFSALVVSPTASKEIIVSSVVDGGRTYDFLGINYPRLRIEQSARESTRLVGGSSQVLLSFFPFGWLRNVGICDKSYIQWPCMSHSLTQSEHEFINVSSLLGLSPH